MFAVGVFEFLGLGFVGLLVVAAAIWFINSKAAKSIWGAGRAQVGKLGSAALAVDPKAVFEQQVRDAKEELNRSITDLEDSKGLTTQLKEQVAVDARDVARLDAKVRASLTDDPEDTKGKAAEYVVSLESAKATHARNNEQLIKAQTIYASNLKKFQLAQKKIKAAEERGRQLGQEVKSSEMNARLAKLAQNYNVDVGALDSRLGEAEEEMRRQIARNNAVGEVQSDLGINGLAEAEEEERLAKAEAKNKLADYKKQMGLTS